MKNVDNFKYLGSIISGDGSFDRDITSRICTASQALGRLHTNVLSLHNIRLCSKFKVYNAVVLTSLLYGCKAWTLYRWYTTQLRQFHTRALRCILVTRYQDRISNLKALERARATGIEAMLLETRRR